MKTSFQRQFILFKNCLFKVKPGQNKHIFEAIVWGSPLELLKTWCDYINKMAFNDDIHQLLSCYANNVTLNIQGQN